MSVTTVDSITRKNSTEMGSSDHATHSYGADGKLDIVAKNNATGKPLSLELSRKNASGVEVFSLRINDEGRVTITEMGADGKVKKTDFDDRKTAGTLMKQWESARNDGQIQPKELAGIENSVAGILQKRDTLEYATAKFNQTAGGEKLSEYCKANVNTACTTITASTATTRSR